MHMPSLWGLLIVAVLAFLLFSKPGRISNMMEDLGKGIRGFRKGLSDPQDQQPPAETPRQVQDQAERQRDNAQN